MYYPTLRPRGRRSCRVDRFLGLDRRTGAPDGSFFDLENLTAERFPGLKVRSRRTEIAALEGNPAESVLAIGGKGVPVILDGEGSLRCGGQVLPHILDRRVALTAVNDRGENIRIFDEDPILEALGTEQTACFILDQDIERFVRADGETSFSYEALASWEGMGHGAGITISQALVLAEDGPRQLVFMGGWVCIFPDGVYANTVRMRQGQYLVQGEDWGKIEQMNVCRQGGTSFIPCGVDGTPWTVTWSPSAPEAGLWVDTSEVGPVLKAWSESRGLWAEVQSYVKCCIPNIAKNITAGDCVELQSHLSTGQEGEGAVMDLWQGSRLLIDAYHDPGDGSREEGTGDYVILEGLLPAAYDIELTWHVQDAFSLRRALPQMDFVVECANRLWGCRWGDGVNELYGSKLGDFRNWSVFEGLSTDSYRVSRGQDGPFTGAAVLGGCPLFFRETCLEKIYPSVRGDHGVVTVSLSGIEAGSGASAAVIRDRLYYKAPEGFCCYGGTLPKNISEALGDLRCHSAVAAALGDRYYVSALDEADRPLLLVYDTRTGIWTKEDGTAFCTAWSRSGRIYYTSAPGGPLQCIGEARDSEGVLWFAETGPLGPDLRTKRYLSRLQLTARLDLGATLRAYLSYDQGPWIPAGEFRGSRTNAETFPIIPRRSGRVRLRLEGRGGMELESIGWLIEAGSDA